MSRRLPALSVFFIVFLRIQSINLAHAQSASSLWDFELPEIDGSAVDPCTFFSDPTPEPIPAMTETTPPATTTKPPQKPETKDIGTPIRPQPAPVGPITNSFSVHRAHYHKLATMLLKRANENQWKTSSSSSEDSSDES